MTCWRGTKSCLAGLLGNWHIISPFLCIMFVIGLVVGSIHASLYVRAAAVNDNFETTSCHILNMKVQEDCSTECVYWPLWTLSFFDQSGQNHTAAAKSFSKFDTTDAALRFGNKFPVGSTQPCYYDPNNVQDCVLDRVDPEFLKAIFACMFGVLCGVPTVYLIAAVTYAALRRSPPFP